jgi:hypothetical protein
MTTDPNRSSTFNPNEHVIQMKSREGTKEYLPVQYRLVWFRQACPQGTIDTEELEYDLDREVEAEVYVWNAEKKRSEKIIKKARGYARYRAVVTDGKGGRATGTKSENAANFGDFGEKAETGAIGRALAGLGYGTQFAIDLDEGVRLADAPVEQNRAAGQGTGNGQTTTGVQASPSTPPVPAQTTQASIESVQPATEQQLLSIGKLCEHLGKDVPTGIKTYEQAKTLLAQFTQQYRESRTKK